MSDHKSQDRYFMKKALLLAKRGEKNTFPNPMVGCLITKNGKTAGYGWHERFGGPHAEINALKMAGGQAAGATMFVTLEPCSHWGKTPPCVDAIIKSGIKRVVSAMSDPNPRISGRGLKKLAMNGINITNNLLSKEAVRLNKRYINALQGGKPTVTVKAAVSLDGKIAANSGDSKWISSKASRNYVHRLRSQYDAVLVGVNTVLYDNPELTSHGKGKNPVRVIIDPSLKTPLNYNVFNDSAPTLVFYCSGSADKIFKLKNKGIALIRVPKIAGKINFKHIIKKLNILHIYKVFIEGGGETISNALNSAVVSDLMIFVSPIIIGGRSAKTAVEGPGINKIRDAIKAKNLSISRLGRDLLVRALLK